MGFPIVNVEKNWVEALISPGGEDPANVACLGGRWLQAYSEETVVRFRLRPRPQIMWEASVAVTASGHSDPCIAQMPTGEIVVAAHRTADSYSWIYLSSDDGQTWTEVSQMALALVSIAQRDGILHAAGYDTGNVKHTISEDAGDTWSVAVTVAASDEEQPAVEVLPTGEVIVSLTNGGVIRHYVSTDHGAIWSEV